ncbi:MAG: hypothetical protein CVU05_15815 [Bacteroidetes bacterium HGW-Bacteroidetes-21]|jgi:hypothetical protein|nr:MAG: hypothetical protein CVU05_15815 [Bacteroidetes bacterium HGW-Bacteroidetes-21]
MKKLVIISILATFTLSGMAQKFSGGLYFSPTFNWMKPDVKQIEKDAMRTSFGFGLEGDFILTDNFVIASGLRFNNMGGSLKYLDTVPKFVTPDSTYKLNPGHVVKYKTQYVGIPIYIKGKTNEIGGIFYFMKAGVVPSFRYSAKGDVTVNSNDDIRDEVRGIYTSFELGGGIEYVLGGNTRVLAEIVYSNGLTDVTKTVLVGKTKTDKVVQNGIMLNVGILF